MVLWLLLQMNTLALEYVAVTKTVPDAAVAVVDVVAAAPEGIHVDKVTVVKH